MTKTFFTPNEIGAALAAQQNGTLPQILITTGSSSAAVTTTQMQGLALYFTPLQSTRVKWAFTAQIAPAATTVWNVYPSYGTGTAPTNGAATAGTQLTYGAGGTAPTGTQVDPFNFVVVIEGLIPGTTYWFDLETVFTTSTMGAITKYTSILEEV